ncbi:MAG: threonine/serine dehydratase [Planctomycetes bacterium]|nr:threonine/serine dehydratase [Planctomycetota bacterium]
MDAPSANQNLSWGSFDSIDVDAAAKRIAPYVKHTPLLALPCDDPRIDLRGKMENLQVTGSFKSRGACNNILLLTEQQRARGVVASSSGNHGRALAWAARMFDVAATIVMPNDAYPNKIQACRDEGAEVVLAADRYQADVITERLKADGKVLIHPFDLAGTIEGTSTIGREIATDWPQVEVVIICVGGGGLAAGTSLALRRSLGPNLQIWGAEPSGAASMRDGLAAGKPVTLHKITTDVQGLCPPHSGALNIAICSSTLNGMFTPDDATIFAAQRRLVQTGENWQPQVVEPAGACAYSSALSGMLPESLLFGRSAENPLRVAVTISGGNPDPAQLVAAQGL